MFGPTEIELVMTLGRKPKKIFKDRLWGDLGFIHLCFDILGMKTLKEECKAKGFPFTVDSDIHPSGKPFDMGEAAGHFSYIEDPDGTLIEFVETHKIPVIQKNGLVHQPLETEGCHRIPAREHPENDQVHESEPGQVAGIVPEALK